MSYLVVYEAEFECPKGHRFTGQASPFESAAAEVMCPTCFQEWIAANIPRAKQVSPAQRADNVTPVALLKGA